MININQSVSDEKKNWKEFHRERKEQKKKWKQESLIKNLEKQIKEKELSLLNPTDEEASESKTVKKALSTISIAVPGSILDNAQSPELRTYLAGQIARAACIFKVDEIIVFDDNGSIGPKNAKRSKYETEDGTTKTISQCCLQLARILQYLECPQYLRKFFFPLHNDLKFSGLLNPLDAPHHLRQYNEFEYREGVVTNKLVKKDKGSFVNIGLLNDCFVNKQINHGLRVTIKLAKNQDLKAKKIKGTVVPPSQPKLETGIYWGYNVRIADSLSHVFSKSPYENGYDVTIGTSDKGKSVHSIESSSIEFNHLLIIFGGLQGIDGAIENDDNLNVDDPSLLFDHYINVVPAQGSRTIRTEEAILIALATLEEKIKPLETVDKIDFTKLIPQSDDTGVKQIEVYKRKKIEVKSKDDMSRFD